MWIEWIPYVAVETTMWWCENRDEFGHDFANRSREDLDRDEGSCFSEGKPRRVERVYGCMRHEQPNGLERDAKNWRRSLRMWEKQRRTSARCGSSSEVAADDEEHVMHMVLEKMQ
uniref:Uncharacterized protein n=1 Tax=Melanopsichium pennsylvanicum 4 TaxID=1398559 RepID=A0A077RC84_9BASI|nr:uncharacterized protein BN887_06265 [Melanopsichium pennsylvanicum 4]